MVSELQKANALLRDEKHQDALNIYNRIKANYPAEGAIYALIAYSIKYCQSKLNIDTSNSGLSPSNINNVSITVDTSVALEKPEYEEAMKVSKIPLPSYSSAPVRVLVDASNQSEHNLLLISARIVFYILLFPNTTVYVLSERRLPGELKAPEWMASGIAEIYSEALKSRLHRIDSVKEGQFFDIYIRYSDTVNENFKKSVSGAQKSRGFRHKIYDCRLSERFEASRIIDAIREFADRYIDNTNLDSPKDIAQSRLAAYAQSVSEFNHCNIILNGPSVANIDKISLVGGHSIVCNTVITNAEVLAHANISLLCFADPIFHFGFNTYASKFRESIVMALHELPDVLIAIPAKYYYVFLGLLPHLSHRVIPLDMAKSDEFNLNLLQNPTLRAVGNVLTLLMLPIACTVSKKINIFGADGRPLHEDTYFWGHDPSSQLDQQKMSDIKKAHPSFFELEYNSYYLNHMDECRQLIEKAESEDVRISLFTPSYIQAFKDKFSPTPPELMNRGQVYIWFDLTKGNIDSNMIFALAHSLSHYPGVSVRFTTHVLGQQVMVKEIIKKIKTIPEMEEFTCQYMPFDSFLKSSRFSIVRITDDPVRLPTESLKILSNNETISRIVTCFLGNNNHAHAIKSALGTMNFNKLHPESRRQIKRFSKLLQSNIVSTSKIIALDSSEKLLKSTEETTWKLLQSTLHTIITFRQLLEILSVDKVDVDQLLVMISIGDISLLESEKLTSKLLKFMKSNKGVAFVCNESTYLYINKLSPRLINHLITVPALSEALVKQEAQAGSIEEHATRIYCLQAGRLHYTSTRWLIDSIHQYLAGSSPISLGENSGKTRSLIALPDRLGIAAPVSSPSKSAPVSNGSVFSKLWININPSADKPYGHYIHFDAMIADGMPPEVLSVSLVNKKFPVDYKTVPNHKIAPVFTQKTSALRHPAHNNSENADEYISELKDVIDHYVSGQSLEKATLFFYDGTLSHLRITTQALVDIANKYQDIEWCFQINLMKSSDISYVQETPIYLQEFDVLNKVPSNLKIVPYIDTQESLDYFYRYFSVPSCFPQLKVLPFFTPTRYKVEKRDPLSRTDIFYHVNSTTEGGLLKKGFDIALDSIIDLAPSLPNYNLVIRRYGAAKYSDIIEEKWQRISKIKNVRIIKKQYISDDEYRKCYLSSAIVVLPYRSTSFGTRTSAGLLDAWMYGAFPVVLSETWMANQIEDVKSVYGAVSRVNDYRSLNSVIKNALVLLHTLAYPEKPTLPDIHPQCFSSHHFVKTLLSDSNG